MKADPELRKALLAKHDEPLKLIVRVRGDVRAHDETLGTLGVEVLRRYRLTSSLSIRCTGSAALKLAEQPWVERIEADRVVRALGR